MDQKVIKVVVFLFSFVIMYNESAFSQMNLSKIDTTKWTVDSLVDVPMYYPEFPITTDTSFYFYRYIGKTKKKILNMTYVNKSKCLYGNFDGTDKDKYRYSFVRFFVGYDSTDIEKIINLGDTVIKSENTIDYCISIKSLAIQDDELNELLTNTYYTEKNNFIRVLHKDNSDNSYSYVVLGIYFATENEPPYLMHELQLTGMLK